MRIAYGVHGYGRGHATRAWSMLAALEQRHEVLVLAGDDAFELLNPRYKVARIPSLGYRYRRGQARRSKWGTIVSNAPHLWDLTQGTGSFRQVKQLLSQFNPDVVISDAEPWTHRAAHALGVPRIGFDHFGVLVYCQADLSPGDALLSLFDRTLYRLLMGSPDRVLVSSFYDARPHRSKVKVVPPLLRPEVRALQPSRGFHLLAYFNRGRAQVEERMIASFKMTGLPVHVYGTGREGRDDNLLFRPAGDRPFLDDLASCRAVISTAGNQLVGEAMALRKPLLVMPERCVEQRLNARAVVRLGLGEAVAFERISAGVIERFLRLAPQYVANAERLARDGTQEALRTVDEWVRELPRARRQGMLSEVPA